MKLPDQEINGPEHKPSQQENKPILSVNDEEVSFASQFIVMAFLIFYNFYPRVMLNAVVILSCVSIDDSDLTYMENMIYYMPITNIVVWGLLTPISIFFFYHKIFYQN